MEFDLVEVDDSSQSATMSPPPSSPAQAENVVNDTASLPSHRARFAYWNLLTPTNSQQEAESSQSVAEIPVEPAMQIPSETSRHQTPEGDENVPHLIHEPPPMEQNHAGDQPTNGDENDIMIVEPDLTPNIERLATLLVSIIILLVFAAIFLPDALHMDGYYGTGLKFNNSPQSSPSSTPAAVFPLANNSPADALESDDECRQRQMLEFDCQRLVEDIGLNVCRTVGQLVKFVKRNRRLIESKSRHIINYISIILRFLHRNLFPSFIHNIVAPRNASEWRDQRMDSGDEAIGVLRNFHVAIIEQSSKYYDSITIMMDSLPKSDSYYYSSPLAWTMQTVSDKLARIFDAVRQKIMIGWTRIAAIVFPKTVA